MTPPRKVWTYKLLVPLISLIVAILMFVPIYWLICASFKTPATILEPTLFPRTISLQSYTKVLGSPFFRYSFLNSMIVAGSATLLTLTLGLLGGYGFSRFRFVGQSPLLFLVLFTKMFPKVMISIAYYLIILRVKLYDTLLSLVLLDVAIALPLALWIIKNYFDTIPTEIEEAALIDGCSRLKAFYYVVLPLSRPGIAAIATYAFLMVWQEFFYAFTFTSSMKTRLVPVIIYAHMGEFVTDYTWMLAASFLFILPLMAIFVLMQRYLISGLTAGSVK